MFYTTQQFHLEKLLHSIAFSMGSLRNAEGLEPNNDNTNTLQFMAMTYHPILSHYFISINGMKLLFAALFCYHFFLEFELRRGK
jgi:hypothetical protein